MFECCTHLFSYLTVGIFILFLCITAENSILNYIFGIIQLNMKDTCAKASHRCHIRHSQLRNTISYLVSTCLDVWSTFYQNYMFLVLMFH